MIKMMILVSLILSGFCAGSADITMAMSAWQSSVLANNVDIQELPIVLPDAAGGERILLLNDQVVYNGKNEQNQYSVYSYALATGVVTEVMPIPVDEHYGTVNLAVLRKREEGHGYLYFHLGNWSPGQDYEYEILSDQTTRKMPGGNINRNFSDVQIHIVQNSLQYQIQLTQEGRTKKVEGLKPYIAMPMGEDNKNLYLKDRQFYSLAAFDRTGTYYLTKWAIDGTDVQVLSERPAVYFQMVDDKIYYETEEALYCLTEDDHSEKKIADIHSLREQNEAYQFQDQSNCSFIVLGEQVYYAGPDGGLYSAGHEKRCYPKETVLSMGLLDTAQGNMGGVLLENDNGEQSFLLLDGCGKIVLRLDHGVDQVFAEKIN